MKKAFCRILALVISIVLIVSCGAYADEAELTAEQRNAIAMLNYITVLTQEINASKNSKLYMEEAYSLLINNTYPNAVDSRTQGQMTGLLDIMESYRMIAVKRDRLQFIYEQNQAKAIRASIPNPLAMLSMVKSYRPSKLIMSLAYMAVDSITSYMAYTSETDLQHLKDGWALDDEQAAVLHNSRKGTFNYMITMVRDNNLPGDLTLTEKTVEDLVAWKNNENVVGRIRFLESNEDVYKSYGGYWLILAESYYENGDYSKCLDALKAYDALGTRIFRKDYEYAKVLPFAIASLDEVCQGDEYVTQAAVYAQSILDNTDYDDWALRYFAAQVFVDLCGMTNDDSYLKKAYDITLDNVNYLVEKQRAINAAYLAPVQETAVPKDATANDKKEISEYNTMLKEKRKKEIPEMYEPLVLNCDLLFALSKEMNIPESDALRIDGILHPKGESLFLSAPMDAKYWAIPNGDMNYDTDNIEFAGTVIKVPVSLVTEATSIVVTIKEKDAEAEVITDWTASDVRRESDTKLSDISVIFTSEQARLHSWKPDAEIVVEIIPHKEVETETFRLTYKSVGTKKEWYDYLKVWEGQKNEWYDYLKVWDNSVTFERVE